MYVFDIRLQGLPNSESSRGGAPLVIVNSRKGGNIRGVASDVVRVGTGSGSGAAVTEVGGRGGGGWPAHRPQWRVGGGRRGRHGSVSDTSGHLKH